MDALNIKHILVQHRYEADDILRHLQRGEKFEALAQKYSTCPSAKFGGDLGNLAGKKTVDADFLEASEALNPNQISAVVKTRFGYHLIQRY